MVSRKFVETVKLNALRSYQIAHAAGIHPSVLSKLVNGIERATPGDTRVLRVAQVLGLRPDECFQTRVDEAPSPKIVTPGDPGGIRGQK